MRYDTADACNGGNDKWKDINGQLLKCFKHNETIEVKFENPNEEWQYSETAEQWILEKIQEKVCLAVEFGEYNYYLSSPGDNTTNTSEDGTLVLVMSTDKNAAYDVRHTLSQDKDILVSSGEETSLQAVFDYGDFLWWVPGTGTPDKYPESTNCDPLQVILTKTNSVIE